MRFKKFFKYIFLVVTILLLSSGMPVYASNVNTDGISEGVTANINDSETGFSKNRSGYLIYLTNANGGVVSDVVYVPFTYKPGDNVTKSGLRTRIQGKFCSRINEYNISEITDGGFNQPPFCVVTDTAYGDSMKAWLKADDDGDGDANGYDVERG